MKINAEIQVRNFQFWSGAIINANSLTTEQLDTIDCILSDVYPEGIDEYELNDLFWFYFDTIKEWLGISTDED